MSHDFQILQKRDSLTQGCYRMINLHDKVALITGGGSWIGKEIAKQFAHAGAKISVLGRDAKKLVQTVGEIQADNGMAIGIPTDITIESSVKNAIHETLSYFEKIDVVIQNAGIFPAASLEEMSLDEWMKVININLTGSFIVLKSIIEVMKTQRSGKIIFISSIAGEKIGLPGFAHYTASKAGMNGLMRTAALELAKYNISVNSINPGNILNQDEYNVSDGEMAAMLDAIPLRRLGKPSDVASLALFLASDASSFITGQNFTVDGGETIGV